MRVGSPPCQATLTAGTGSENSCLNISSKVSESIRCGPGELEPISFFR